MKAMHKGLAIGGVVVAVAAAVTGVAMLSGCSTAERVSDGVKDVVSDEMKNGVAEVADSANAAIDEVTGQENADEESAEATSDSADETEDVDNGDDNTDDASDDEQ